jgi:phosphatidylinositol dimannoside acyltransferase
MSEDRESVQERLAYRAYAAMEWVAMSAPDRLGRAAFSALGSAAFHLAPGARSVVAGNLARVMGRPAGSSLVQAATREAFGLYARYWYDTYRGRMLSSDEIRTRFRMAGRERIDRALEAGRGAIVALPHMGNWDAAGQFMAASGYRLVSVAEELRPRRLAELFLEHRKALGMEILVMERGRVTGIRLAQLLAANSVVALVADRNLTGRGVEVDMFGGPRILPAGPAQLSLSTGAPLLSAGVYTAEDGWDCIILGPLEVDRTGSMGDDVKALTRLLAAEFERVIAARPVDWHMFQPAWPEDGEAKTASLLNPE